MMALFTFRFQSPLSLGTMFVRLNGGDFWSWAERDSDRWGEYISSRCLPEFAEPEYAMLKIIPDEGCYDLNVKYESDSRDAEARFRSLRETLVDRLLPRLEAQNVQELDDEYH